MHDEETAESKEPKEIDKPIVCFVTTSVVVAALDVVCCVVCVCVTVTYAFGWLARKNFVPRLLRVRTDVARSPSIGPGKYVCRVF